MEDYAFARPNQAHQLGELGGVVKVFLLMKDMDYLDVSPHILKKYVVGQAMAPKDLIPMHILKKFGVEPIGGDHADAVGLSFLGYHALRYASGVDEGYNQKERESFETFLSLETKKKHKKKSTSQLAREIGE
jgi:Holliday junction resolvasome RuvABC endonuclease subunit